MASDFVCSSVSYQRLDFVLSFTYQTSCAMNARLALPAADLIVGTMRCLQMAFAASVPLQHHDQTRPAERPIGGSHPLEMPTFHTGVLSCWVFSTGPGVAGDRVFIERLLICHAA